MWDLTGVCAEYHGIVFLPRSIDLYQKKASPGGEASDQSAVISFVRGMNGIPAIP